ncbi:MAG: NifB/NifX family molybdenum-iron cluster-binding protein [Anaerolineales bacterium]
MKLAITVNTPLINSPLEHRFGRCSYFLVIETETHAWESLPNPAAEASGGAGPQAAQFLANQGVDAVVSGDYGPKAFTALASAGIQMYSVQEGQAEALLEDFLNGNLERVTESTGEQRHGGH